MSKVDPSNVLFFFGAGASSAFGIPTMKQFVNDFEQYLKENASIDERDLYMDIKDTLQGRMHREVDLEAIFSVIDGVINYDDPEKLGMLALYFASEFKKHFPNKDHVEIAKKLKQKFQTYVKEKCVPPEQSYSKFSQVYKDFFNRFAKELGSFDRNAGYYYYSNWVIFTTNYDTCLESYWCQTANVGIDTNFEFDNARRVNVLRPLKILNEGSGEIKLFKLHGSISWQVEEKTGDVIEVWDKGNSIIGRRYVGELMLYPIAEKELYLDPYISMLLRLNRELSKKTVWIVIGYSFNDPVIQEIFLRNSSESKHLILVDPNADEIHTKLLQGLKGKLSSLNKKFGVVDESKSTSPIPDESYKKVNHQIMHKIVGIPKYGWNDEV